MVVKCCYFVVFLEIGMKCLSYIRICEKRREMRVFLRNADMCLLFSVFLTKINTCPNISLHKWFMKICAISPIVLNMCPKAWNACNHEYAMQCLLKGKDYVLFHDLREYSSFALHMREDSRISWKIDKTLPFKPREHSISGGYFAIFN